MAKKSVKTTPSGKKKTDQTGAKRQTTTATGSSGNKGQDGREQVRVPVQLLVDYRADGHYLFDFCRDLGTGGVFIETSSPLPAGSTLDLTFTIPDSKQTLRTSGTVIWAQPPVDGRKNLTPGMGIQFSGFTGEQRTALEEFVRRTHGDQALSPTGKKTA